MGCVHPSAPGVLPSNIRRDATSDTSIEEIPYMLWTQLLNSNVKSQVFYVQAWYVWRLIYHRRKEFVWRPSRQAPNTFGRVIDWDIRSGEFDVRHTATSTVRPLFIPKQSLFRGLPTRREERDQYESGRCLYTAIEARRMVVDRLPRMHCKLPHRIYVLKATLSATLAVQRT